MASNKMEVSFKLEDIPMIIETMQQLQQENQQLKDNWNKLKQDIDYELLKLREPNEYNNGLVNGINYVLNTMQELEKSDNNE